jgi:hypothetical protein
LDRIIVEVILRGLPVFALLFPSPDFTVLTGVPSVLSGIGRLLHRSPLKKALLCKFGPMFLISIRFGFEIGVSRSAHVTNGLKSGDGSGQVTDHTALLMRQKTTALGNPHGTLYFTHGFREKHLNLAVRV